MDRFLKLMALFVICFIVVFSTGCASSPVLKDNGRPIILVAAFGSSYPTGLKNYNDFHKSLRAAFPENQILWGFTASFIVKKLRKQGTTTVFDSQEPLLSIEEAFEIVKQSDIKDVVLVNFLLMVGGEYKQVMDIPTGDLNIKNVHPLLYYDENIKNAVISLEQYIADDDMTATIFVAHGNEKTPEYNAELEQFDRYLQDNYKNTWMVSVEGTPSWNDARDAVLAAGVSKVQFVTFMLSYGDHMTNDVMGDEPESMKSQLGLPAKITDGLASIEPFQNLFIDRIREALR